MDDERSPLGRRNAAARSALGIDLGIALIAGTIWALTALYRLRTTAPLVFVGATGGSALTLGALLVAARRARPLSETARIVILGGFASSGPVSVLGAVIQTKTHHRALGAVAFALTTSFVVSFFSLIVRRMRQMRPQGRLAASALALMSTGWMVRSLLQPAELVRNLDLVVDAVIGGTLFVVALAVPRVSLPARLAKAGLSAWVLAVTSGLVVLVRNVPVRAELEARAPLTLGAVQVLPDP